MEPIWSRESWLQSGTKAQRELTAKLNPLAWALEYQPKILLPGKGFIVYDPWPFQQQFLLCRDTFRAINKPRQCGISTTAAIDVAWEFDNVPGAQIVIISKDQDAATNFHRYVRNILLSVRENKDDAPKLIKDNERETTNDLGNRIVSLAASKEAGRSFSATHLVLDELAFQQYAEEIWQAANATLAQTGGRVTVISTGKGRGNLFHRIITARPAKHQSDGLCGVKLNEMGFHVFTYGWWDVPTYNPYYKQYSEAKLAGDKKAAEAWIDRARKEKGGWYSRNRPKYTELAWLQEFEGSFDAFAGSVFSTRQIEKAFHRNWLTEKEAEGYLTRWYTSKHQENHLYACGIDLGKKNDATVIVTYDYSNKPAQIVDFKYIEAGQTDWQTIAKICREHLDYWKPESLHDGTGVGEFVTDMLGGDSESFKFTKEKKENIINLVQHAMDHQVIRMPKIDILYREHQAYLWDDKNIVQDTLIANAVVASIFHTMDSLSTVVSDFNFVEAAA